MTHFQFTSPNAAGAEDNQAMLIAMREALLEVQKVEVDTINAAPKIAEIEGEAIQNQANQEAKQMRCQGAGSILGGATGFLAGGLEIRNTHEATQTETLNETANLFDSYANALEDGATAPRGPALTSEARNGEGVVQPTDLEESAEQIEANNQRSQSVKEQVRDEFEKPVEETKTLKERKADLKARKESLEEDKVKLRQKSAEMTEEHRSEMIKRFRNKANSLRSDARALSDAHSKQTNINMQIGQVGNALGQTVGSYGGATAKVQAGTEQRQAEMSRLLAQGRQKTEDNASGQVKSVSDALKGAVDAQRNYYSTRG